MSYKSYRLNYLRKDMDPIENCKACGSTDMYNFCDGCECQTCWEWHLNKYRKESGDNE